MIFRRTSVRGDTEPKNDILILLLNSSMCPGVLGKKSSSLSITCVVNSLSVLRTNSKARL